MPSRPDLNANYACRIFLAQQLAFSRTKRISCVHHFLQILLLCKNGKDEATQQQQSGVTSGPSWSVLDTATSIFFFQLRFICGDCMSSEHFGHLVWEFKRVSGSSGLKVQAAIAC
jgi:hypothetical protein